MASLFFYEFLRQNAKFLGLPLPAIRAQRKAAKLVDLSKKNAKKNRSHFRPHEGKNGLTFFYEFSKTKRAANGAAIGIEFCKK